MVIKRLIIIIVIAAIFVGCKNTVGKKPSEYLAPQKYYAQTKLTTYSNTDKNIISYNMDILYNNNEYKIKIKYKDMDFFIGFAEGKCTLINSKFKSNQIEGSLNAFKGFIEEINLDKFNGIVAKASNCVEISIGIYKYTLEYEKGNYKPIKLLIYRDNALFKTLEYNNVELYK